MKASFLLPLILLLLFPFEKSCQEKEEGERQNWVSHPPTPHLILYRPEKGVGERAIWGSFLFWAVVVKEREGEIGGDWGNNSFLFPSSPSSSSLFESRKRERTEDDGRGIFDRKEQLLLSECNLPRLLFLKVLILREARRNCAKANDDLQKSV